MLLSSDLQFNQRRDYESDVEKHCERIEFIRNRVIKLEEIWECEWDLMVKSNEELSSFVKTKILEKP